MSLKLLPVAASGSAEPALGLTGKRWPADATFLYLFNKDHPQEFGLEPQAWMMSQIAGGSESLDHLVCDGKSMPTATPTAPA